MIGLAEQGRATLGVIVAPAWGRAFVGVVGEGAWEVAADGSRRPSTSRRARRLAGATLVVSRSRTPERVGGVHGVARRRRRPCRTAAPASRARSSPPARPTSTCSPGRAGMRWDACATEALVLRRGRRVHRRRRRALRLRAAPNLENSRGIVATNGALARRVCSPPSRSHGTHADARPAPTSSSSAPASWACRSPTTWREHGRARTSPSSTGATSAAAPAGATAAACARSGRARPTCA